MVVVTGAGTVEATLEVVEVALTCVVAGALGAVKGLTEGEVVTGALVVLTTVEVTLVTDDVETGAETVVVGALRVCGCARNSVLETEETGATV